MPVHCDLCRLQLKVLGVNSSASTTSVNNNLSTHISCVCGCVLCRKCLSARPKDNGNSWSCPACKRMLNFLPQQFNVKWVELVNFCSSIPTCISSCSVKIEKLKRQVQLDAVKTAPVGGSTPVKSPQCSECYKKAAVCKCFQCDGDFCGECFKRVHESAKVLKSHQKIAIASAGKEAFCTEHHKFKEMFCCDDNVMSCPDCVQDWHSSHKVRL